MALGGQWKVDPHLLELAVPKKDLTDKFFERFKCTEENTIRACSFITDLLFNKTDTEILSLKNTFEEMVYWCVDRKR